MKGKLFRFNFRIQTILVLTIILLASLNRVSWYSIKVLADDQESSGGLEKEIDEQKEKLEKTENKLKDYQKKSNDIDNTIKGLSGQLNVTRSQLNNVKNQINEFTDEINNLNIKLDLRSKELDRKITVKNDALRNLYIANQTGLITLLLAEKNIKESLATITYHKKFIDASEGIIGGINEDINTYNDEKKQIEDLKAKIETQKKNLEGLSSKIQSEVAGYKDELAQISQSRLALEQERAQISKKLSELSAAQKGILQEKTDTFTSSVGDVPATGEKESRADYDPGFKKAFAAFSFGAPHRKGMSQYGAKGRAEEGQDYKEILKAYYGDIDIENPDIPSKINTDKGSMDIDGKYLKGLAEMPASWPMEALKAQAIAARTYALSYVGWRNNGGGGSGKICTTENCQVWSSSKASSGSAKRWHEAVEATKGKVMISKDTNELFSSWYAATSGGFNFKYTSLGHTTGGGWDTKCKGKDCWTKDAYENIAGSPWFYKGWFKSRGGNSCGRKHPWLSEEEFADIIGALVLYEDDDDNQKHLSQIDAKNAMVKM